MIYILIIIAGVVFVCAPATRLLTKLIATIACKTKPESKVIGKNNM